MEVNLLDEWRREGLLQDVPLFYRAWRSVDLPVVRGQLPISSSLEWAVDWGLKVYLPSSLLRLLGNLELNAILL